VAEAQTGPESPAAPPINLSVGPDGRRVISSQDTAALDLFEELLSQLTPSHPDYEVFRLQYADAYYVKENLVEFFAEEEENSQQSAIRYYIYDYGLPRNDEPRYRLSRRRKLKMIYDYETNSILVSGADPQQLRLIRELIAVYDQPEAPDSQSARITSVVQVHYSKAQVIADAVKDVYRDLLSSNDKALQQQQNPEERNRPSSATTYIFNEGGDQGQQERTPVTFKGKLSIGVDELSNTLLVSVEGETLMRNVREMITSLDKAAQPLSAVSAVPVSGRVNSERVREVLAKILAEQAKPAVATPQQPGNQPAQGGPPAQRPSSQR
jgi:hypothetical protein